METPGWLTREKPVPLYIELPARRLAESCSPQAVENDRRVLISDGRNGLIDMADIEKFNTGQDDNFTAFNVLLHELYEQYQQVVEKLQPGK